jgi:hypothetical protein
MEPYGNDKKKNSTILETLQKPKKRKKEKKKEIF